MRTMIFRISMITLIGLAGCTTANDVALRQAQASIEQAREGQILAAGLAGSSNWTAAAVFVLVLTLCLVVLLITWSFINRRAVRQAETQIKLPVQNKPRSQVGSLPGVPFALLTPEEQRFVMALRAQRVMLSQPALTPGQEMQWQPVEDDAINPWGQG